eukprot:CAMPEP_0183716380 /NCGR_PEP_ID=MMETSP0737-20130205/10326_1 /TAXON_ID=385413 /ORGANISM="Thalassiosira miniscula, Strain CCMP1093" /LENGTH=58 /DNA_ID=CAMNT_0025945647 /DNA_START=315 /DNA_END=491 /DNA_ORIENTATION=-
MINVLRSRCIALADAGHQIQIAKKAEEGDKSKHIGNKFKWHQLSYNSSPMIANGLYLC